MKIVMRYFIIFLLIGTASSCKKFLDVNTNPNAPVKPPINGLLARVTLNAALNVYRVSNITSYYVQYLSSPNPSSPTDIYEPIDASGTWTSLYDNMTDSYDLEKMAGNTPQIGAFAYLDNPSIIIELLDFQNATISKITFFRYQVMQTITHLDSCFYIWYFTNSHIRRIYV